MNDRPLRILTVADVPPDPNSGAPGTVYHTNVALRELGHEVDEVWADDLGPRRIRHGNLHSLLEQPRAYRNVVVRLVAKKDYDVVMMSQPQAYLAACGLKRCGFAGLVINRSHGLELRVNAVLPAWHRSLGVPESRFPRTLTPMLRNLLDRQWTAVAKWSDGIIVPCEMDREFLVNAFPFARNKVRTIYHGVPREFLDPVVAPMTAERARHVLYVGQYSFIKGTRLLPQIANRLLARVPHAMFTWVTPAAAPAEIREQLDPVVRDRVRLMTAMPQRELLALFDQHAVFIFPSLFEGAGKAALEAMARGLCVVASDTGAMRDHIRDGHNGLLCPVGDVDRFVDRLSTIIGHVERLSDVSQQAARTATEFSWNKCASEMCEFYRELCHAPDSIATALATGHV